MKNKRHERRRASLYRQRQELRDLIAKTLAGPSPLVPVNLSLPRHAVTAPVLRDFVYSCEPKHRNALLPLIFADGSHPAPFPVGRFEDGECPKSRTEVETLRVGLMSFRHPELDYLVDVYVTRNEELAETPGMDEEEQLAFERTVELLSDPVLKSGGEIGAFHTGLEPMVIGFYRGVVHVLERRRRDKLPRTLVIRTWNYDGPKLDENLTPDSPGAKQDNYEPCASWW